MKICRNCNQNFEPSSKHLDCPSCRYHLSKKVLCHSCKVHFHSPRYQNCRSCTTKLKPDYGKGSYIKNGYRMVFSAEHPKVKDKRSKYIFEHVLVMEEHIGRYLLDRENVHHLNGVRDDNRLKNLELWIKTQPSGIRVEDAVNWAHEIIERYSKPRE